MSPLSRYASDAYVQSHISRSQKAANSVIAMEQLFTAKRIALHQFEVMNNVSP